MSIVNLLDQLKTNGQFKNYIDFIKFPFYRNLELNTKINFDFPLTVFIGQNGCGKSSCLHALQGAPDGYTPFKFWFDTKVDPIEYYNDTKKRHSFWYSFIDEDKVIREVIKARIKRGNDPNYWETSRPLLWAGMKKKEDKNNRDSPVKKNVVYIDFRSELSAFDKYYYFGDTKNLSVRNKQEFIRKKSISLNKVLSGKEVSIKNRAGDINKPIRILTKEELKHISYILGKDYNSGKYLEHSFFRNQGYSIFFSTSHANYSEAFAGSGEVAVVKLVLLTLEAKPHSLLLLDEPEVSLHPGAQDRLKLFLLEQIKKKKHQVVICTHSPSLVKGLPKESIKVFIQNIINGRFFVRENISPEEAFYHIELPIDKKKIILVEDILAKLILEEVLKEMGEAILNLFSITFHPGGESVLHTEFAPIYSRESNSDTYIFFDGDQRPENGLCNWREIPCGNLDSAHLQAIIKNQTNSDKVKFSVDSGANKEEQKVELQKKYMDYYINNVFYLPNNIPEEIIWDQNYATDLLRLHNLNEDWEEKLNQLCHFKEKFALIANELNGDSSSISILNYHKQFIKRWISKKNADYLQIVSDIQNIIS